MARQRVVISDDQRLCRFFRYCKELDNSAFLRDIGAGPVTAKLHINGRTGEITFESNFDNDRLEVLLTRVRQFAKDGEALHYKELRRSAVALFGPDDKLENVCRSIRGFLHRPIPNRGMFLLTPDGRTIDENRSFMELLPAALYAGQLHTEQWIVPQPGSVLDGMQDLHPASFNLLRTMLATNVPGVVQLIGFLRNRIYEMALAADKIDLFPELTDFHVTQQTGHA